MSEQGVPVTQAQVRQLLLEIGAYQVHYLLSDLIGDVWRDLDVSGELERKIASGLIDSVERLLTPIKAQIQTTAEADEYVHAIAGVNAPELNQRASIGATNIRLSTSALSDHRLPMMEESA